MAEGFKHYRKRPVVVQAKQMGEPFEVQTLEGTMRGKAGDYLIIGVIGERYPCDKEIFERTYEEVQL
ncbi:MAG: PGDYG domain-containing protein [Actinomycetia bacterium]|nr:PGDYG domain-containing protein [Actinomycetes bacterium]